MSAFTQGFQHGFIHGMFDRMFCGWNMFACWNQAPMFFTPSYMQGGFFQYQTPVMSMPSVWNMNVPDFSSVQPNWGAAQSINYTMPDFSSSFDWGDTFVKSSSKKSGNKHETKKYSDNDTSYFSYDAEDLKKKWDSKRPGLSQEFYNKVVQVAKRVGCDSNDLMGLMNSESGINADKVNSIGATGLIQFMPETAKGLGTSTTALKTMSPEEQLVYVEKHLLNAKKSAGYSNSEKISAGTLYALTFLPAYAKQDILSTQGDKYYAQNSGLDLDNDGKISKADLANRIKEKRA